MSEYREGALACPACANSLDPLAVEVGAETAGIDVCSSCGGAWVDWEDGDIVHVLRAAPPVPLSESNIREHTGACPRCRVELAPTDDLARGLIVLRCPNCVGVFVTREQARAIAQLVPADQRDEGPSGFWPRLVLKLKGLFGGSAAEPEKTDES